MRTKWLILLSLVIHAPAVQATQERELNQSQPPSYTKPEVPPTPDRVFDDRIDGTFYHQGDEGARAAVELPFSANLVQRVRLFDRQTAYRNDRKACVTFELPVRHPKAVQAINIYLDAYNDDSSYLRAIWFEIDGVGGYLGVSKIGKGQYGGGGTIGPKERKSWTLPLDRFPASIKGEADSEVDFADQLRQPGPHTLCSWISTYEQYGPNSWITLDLEIVAKMEGRP